MDELSQMCADLLSNPTLLRFDEGGCLDASCTEESLVIFLGSRTGQQQVLTGIAMGY